MTHSVSPSDVMKRLKNSEKMTLDIIEGHSGKRGGAQKLNLVNEPGLYRLIFTSRKAEAEKFQDWVYHEVLPSIRKTGVYSNDKAYQKWLETREHGKISRKQETSAIKIFIEYAKSQGCTWEDWYFYSTISIWANIGAGLPKKNGRDNATVHQLNIIDLLEGTVIRKVLIDGIANGLHYTQIWAKTQQQIDMFLKITFQEPELLTA